MAPTRYAAFNSLGLGTFCAHFTATPTLTSGFTACAWIHYDPSAVNGLISAVRGVYALEAINNGFVLTLQGQHPQALIVVDKVLSEGWHMIAVTVNAATPSATAQFYFDGISIGQTSVTAPAASTEPMWLSLATRMRGRYRKLSFYEQVLTAAQITDLQFDEIPGSDAPVPAFAVLFDGNPVHISINGTQDDSLTFASLDVLQTENTRIAEEPGARRVSTETGNNLPSTNMLSASDPAVGTCLYYTPALEFDETGFAVPAHDPHVNPGGRQVDPYTVQAWIYINEASPVQTIFVNSDIYRDAGIGLRVVYNSTTSQFALESRRGSSSTGPCASSAASIPVGSWVNVATTYDGTTLSTYINGVVSGTPLTTGPIPEALFEGDISIGSGFAPMRAGGVDSLRGFIARLEVWNTALSAAQISQYMTTEPDSTAQGIQALYDFSLHPAKNWVTGNGVSVGDHARFAEQRSVIPYTPPPAPPLPPSLDHDFAAPTVSEEMLARWRQQVDPIAFLQNHRTLFEECRAEDIARAADAEATKVIDAEFSRLMERLEAGVGPLMPLMFTCHQEQGRFYLVSHHPAGSTVLLDAELTETTECILWRVSLVLIVIAGVLGLFGIFVPRTVTTGSRAYTLLLRLLQSSRVQAILARGSGMTGRTLFALAIAIYETGLLKPLIKALVDIGFWGMLCLIGHVAAYFLSAGAAAAVQLAVTVAAFIDQYVNHKPASCDAPPKIVVKAIKFRHAPHGKAYQALPLRKDRFTPIDQPEWRNDMSGTCSVLYAASEVSGKTITIKVAFEASKQEAFSATIWATGGGRLGPTNRVPVSFVNGRSSPEYVEFELADHQIGHNGISSQSFSFSWQYQLNTTSELGEDSALGTPPTPKTITTASGHSFETLFDPFDPWLVSDEHVSRNAWVSALEVVAPIVEGSKTKGDVMHKVTNAIHQSSYLTYASADGAPTFVAGNTFKLTRFLAAYSSATPPSGGTPVNCADVASAVVTFANLYGAELKAVSLAPARPSQTVELNKSEKIGPGNLGHWHWPGVQTRSGQPGKSNFHEVAADEITSDERTTYIYDACLSIDVGTHPWNWTDTTVTHVPGGVGFQFDPPGDEPWEGPHDTYVPLAMPYTELLYRTRVGWNGEDGIPRCILQSANFSSDGRRKFV